MSQENVEIVRRSIEAFNQGDRAGFIGLTDPSVEWWDRDDDPGAAVHRGHDGISTFLAELGDDVELQLEPLKFIEADDLVVVQLRLVGRGRTSGIPFEENEVHVIRLRETKIIETHEYREMSEALKAVGLEE